MVTLRNCTPIGSSGNPPPTHRHGTHDRQPGKAVVHHQTHRAGIAVAALDAAQVTFCSGRNNSHCRRTRKVTTRQFADVIACVGEAERSPIQRRLRFVSWRFALRLADPLLTLVIPVADERPVVRRRAVGVHHHLVAVGRQRHELLERRGVADHPRGQHGAAGHHGHHAGGATARLAHSDRVNMIHGNASSGSSKIPSPRASAATRSPRRTVRQCQARPITPAIGKDHRHRDQQGHQTLWVQQAVDQPQVGVDRSE